MLAIIKTFWKPIAAGSLVLALVTAVGLFVSHYQGLKADLAAARAEARHMQADIVNRDMSLRVLTERLEAAHSQRETYRAIVEGIANAEPTQDGSVAPVLRRTLDALGRVPG